MSGRGGGSTGKRKHVSTGSSASRVQQKKLQSKAAKRNSASAASAGSRMSAAAEQQLADSLFFDSDGDDDGNKRSRGGDNDMLIRGPRGARDEDDDDDDGARDDHDAVEIDPYAAETPDEKRVRLAREFLTKIEQDVDAEAEEREEEIDDEAAREEDEEERRGITRDAAIDRKLKANLQAQQGKLKSFVAHARYDASSFPPAQSSSFMRMLPGHRKGGATCITMTEDCAAMYTGGKDTNLMAWDVETGKRLRTIYGNRGGKYAHLENNAAGHTEQVLAVSVSSDGNLLASGSRDHTVKIWDPRANYACVKTFGGHKAAVSAVAFRLGTHELFTASWDRTIRLYNIDQFAFVETLYGHTSEVNGLDCLYRQRCLSVSSDKTSRLWKISEESQLMFRASVFCESLDAVAMINEEQFITGGQDGTVAAWINTKKKPTSVIQAAHPRVQLESSDAAAAASAAAVSTAAEPAPAQQGRWINSVGAQRFTDVCFSGSSDGYLNLYCLESSGRLTNKLNLLHRIPVAGHLNGMVSDARDGRFVAIATGREHRLGRWEQIEKAPSGIAFVSLAGVDRIRSQQEENAAEGERKEGERDEEDDENQQAEDGAEDGMHDAPQRPKGRASSAAASAAAALKSKRDAFAGADEDEEEEEEEEPRFGVPSHAQQATVSAYSVGSATASSARKPSKLQQAKMAAKKPTASRPSRGGRGGRGRGR